MWNKAVVTDVMEVNYLTTLCQLTRLYKAKFKMTQFPITAAFLKKKDGRKYGENTRSKTRQEAGRRKEKVVD